ncbi:hypothetical protein [uncultured Variovorax sp.]|uniref:alkaline phosphatase D family protein n=1 Tax=uncultured Variovorax sp. TaxID=114708 RepID=UPI002617E951|nr:hypothetical protein [uncultured Variovorax sp.]
MNALPIERRQFLALGAGAAATGLMGLPLQGSARSGNEWNAGQLLHLIPIANHERFLIKASFRTPLKSPPQLGVDGKRIAGVKTDSQGRFWRFDVRGLRPSTHYELRILDAKGSALCDSWPLKTFPAPDTMPERLRILAYTCAGGYDAESFKGKSAFLDMAARRRLLAKGMSFNPDAVIANGDHIYWDQKTWDNKPFAQLVKSDVRPRFGGELDLSLPMYHPRNIGIFTQVCDYQIPGLYGTTLRSTPAWFLTDDHDMFDNDEFDDQLATLPVEDYGRVGAELTQQMYYPEFLPDANRPQWLPGGNRAGQPEGTNCNFGTLRYGKLFETVLYDCRRYLDNKGIHARVIPRWVEDWVLARTRAEDTAHFFHTPSLPFAYSSGKLGDWYPDLLNEKTGKLVGNVPKDGWQAGWHKQHQRLVAALSEQKKRSAVIVQGDFHASAAGRMVRSAELDLGANPVHAIMTGTLGTGDLGFPSVFRNVESMPALSVDMEQALRPAEKNGFTIIDITPEKMSFSLYLWRPPEAVEAIDSLAPAIVYEVPRRA